MSTRQLDPPQRRGWVRVLPPHKAATQLLRDYVESRVGCPDRLAKDESQEARRHESACCRSFLGSANAVMADDNAAGIEIAATKGIDRSKGAPMEIVSIFFSIPGVGAIAWLPTLVVPLSDRLASILRETSAFRLNIAPEDRPRRTKGDGDDAARRGFPPKAETRLIPGRQL